MIDDAEFDLTLDAFLGGRVKIWQPRRGYRAAIDPVLLAAYAPASTGQFVLDLGCGAGAATLCLAARVPGLQLYGLELQPDYAVLARRNAEANDVAFVVHEGDLLRPPQELRSLDFDLLLANPPYHRAVATAARDAGRDRAFREYGACLSDWIDAGLRRLRPSGVFALVHLPARLGEILSALEGRAGAVEVLPIASREGRAAERVLVRARKGSRAKLALLPPLVLHDAESGDYTEAAKTVLWDGAAIPGLPR